MVIKNKELVALVVEQTQCFDDNAPQEKKIDVFKRIQKIQKSRKKSEDNE
jgi:hypothetical protein